MKMSRENPSPNTAAEVDRTLQAQDADRHDGLGLPLDSLQLPQYKPCEAGRYLSIPAKNVLDPLGSESQDPTGKNAVVSLGLLKPRETSLDPTCEGQNKSPQVHTSFKLSTVGAVQNSMNDTGELDGEYSNVHRHDDEPTFSDSEAVTRQSAMLSMVGAWCDDYADSHVGTNGTGI